MELTFSIRSHTHYISFLRKLISRLDLFFPNLRLTHQDKLKCSLAVIEAVNNAIFHAHKKDVEKWIDLKVICKSGKLSFEVWDCGNGFCLPKNIDLPDLTSDGRGLFIIDSVMNKVEYKRGKKNVLRMEYGNI